MEPNQLLDWLNTYMERMVNIIISHGGVVDDYYGDMIKAGFGVLKTGQMEEDIGQDARKAVSCAIAMEQEMIRLNREWQEHGLSAVRMRVGIYTGSVVVGSLGSAQRLKFTTLGDSVNIAARLESFQKDSAEWWAGEEVCRILLGDTTKQYLGNQPWSLKEVGVVALKGKAIGVSVYKLCSRKKN
jgi:adenylate cyclase